MLETYFVISNSPTLGTHDETIYLAKCCQAIKMTPECVHFVVYIVEIIVPEDFHGDKNTRETCSSDTSMQ